MLKRSLSLVLIIMMLVVNAAVYSSALVVDYSKPHKGFRRTFESIDDFYDHLKETHTDQYDARYRYENIIDLKAIDELGEFCTIHCDEYDVNVYYKHQNENGDAISYHLRISSDSGMTEEIREFYTVNNYMDFVKIMKEDYEQIRIKQPDAYIDDLVLDCYTDDGNEYNRAFLFINEGFYTQFGDGNMMLDNGIDLTKYTDREVDQYTVIFNQDGFVYTYDRNEDSYYQKSGNSRNNENDYWERTHFVYCEEMTDMYYSLRCRMIGEMGYCDDFDRSDDFGKSFVNVDTYKQAWYELLNISPEEDGDPSQDQDTDKIRQKKAQYWHIVFLIGAVGLFGTVIIILWRTTRKKNQGKR